MKISFVYKTVNKLTGEFYVGVHGTKNLNDGYLGSGNRIRHQIKKYGRDIFEVESRIFCDSYQEAVDLERLIVDIELLSNPLCLNIIEGGKGGEHFNERKPRRKVYGIRPSEETKAKISKAKSVTSPETSAKMSTAAKARMVPMTCPHCGHVGIVPNVLRWHFNNCKKAVF